MQRRPCPEGAAEFPDRDILYFNLRLSRPALKLLNGSLLDFRAGGREPSCNILMLSVGFMRANQLAKL